MSYVLLDGIPFYTKEEIDNEFSEGAVGDERARAEAAEQANAAAIEAEVTRATESENALQSQLQDVEGLAEQTSVELGAETIRAKAAENVNAGDIATERSRAIAAEGQIATDIITEAARATAAEQTAQNNVDAINAKIPVAASTQNQLADKAYVEDSIRVADASFKGSYATVSAIPADYNDYPADSSGNKKPNANDYIYVRDASGYQSETLTGCWKFKYTGDWDTDGVAGWLPEYAVSDSVFNQAQVNALNSGIDSTKVAQIATNTQNIDTIEALIPAEATAQNQLADKDSVDTAIAAADKIFYITITDNGSTVTADKTSTEIFTAIQNGKTPVAKRINGTKYEFYVYSFNDIIYGNNIIYFSACKDKRDEYNSSQGLTASGYMCVCYSSQDTWKSYSTDLQKDIYVDLNLSGKTPAITSAQQAELDARLLKDKVLFSVTDNLAWTLQRTGRAGNDHRADLYGIYNMPMDNNTDECRAVVRYGTWKSPGGGLQAGMYYDDYYLPSEYDITASGSGVNVNARGIMFVKINKKAYGPTVQLTKKAGYPIVTILNDPTTTYSITVYFTGKDGSSKTHTLAPGKLARFIWNERGFICEHTIPLTGTDDQGNSFAYDVVVQD